MNTPGNKRRKESQKKIESAFVELIQYKELKEISVTEICANAHINRTTFYANYLDVFDLAEKIGKKLENDVASLYAEERASGQNSYNFLKLVNNVYENQLFYKTYFKLGLDHSYIIREYDSAAAAKLYQDVHIDYHILFFMAGFNALLKKWLLEGCPFPPEEFIQILVSEYQEKDILKKIMELPH